MYKVSLGILFQKKENACSQANGIVSKGFQNQIKGLPLARVRTIRASEIIMSITNGNTLSNTDRKKKRKGKERREDFLDKKR